MAYVARIPVSVVGIAVKAKPIKLLMIRPWKDQLGPKCLFVSTTTSYFYVKGAKQDFISEHLRTTSKTFGPAWPHIPT